MYRKWTGEEENFLRENWHQKASYLSNKLNRPRASIHNKGIKIGLPKKRQPIPDELKEELKERYNGTTALITELAEKYQLPRYTITSTAIRLGLATKSPKGWSTSDIQFLEDYWELGVKYCAKKLNRTEVSVTLKAKRLGLGGVVGRSGYFTAREVSNIMGIDTHVVKRWMEQGLLRYKKAKVNRVTYQIEWKDLENFLKRHQDLWNSQKVKEMLWVTEPEWMKKKRKADSTRAKREAAKWTPEEDKRLISMFKSGAYKNTEIAVHLGRSRVSVQHRLRRLDVWGTGKFIGKKTPH